MNVLLVNSIFWGGGVDSQTVTLARALSRAGAKVAVAVPAGARMLPLVRVLPGIRVETIEAGRLRWPFALARLIRSHQADVIHAHHGRDYWMAMLAARLPFCRARVVVTRHLMTPISAGTRRLLARSATIIAVSAAVERALRAQSFPRPPDIRRIACGIDTDLFIDSQERRQTARAQWELARDTFVFALVANANPPDGKGHTYFVEAAAQVMRRCPNARFLCVGGGAMVPALKEQAAALGVFLKFRFVEFVDGWALRLPGIDVLVHPAVGSEALGLVILEALSCSRPVIASALDGIPETFSDPLHGRLVPPRDSDSLARAMIGLAEDPAMAREMGERGRQWIVERYSSARLGAQTLALYEEICGKRAPLRAQSTSNREGTGHPTS